MLYYTVNLLTSGATFKSPLFDIILHRHSFLMMQGGFTFRFVVLILVWVYLLYLLYVYVCNIVLCCVQIYSLVILYSYVFHLFLLQIMYTLIQLLDICCWCFLFCHRLRLCHSQCGPGKTALLLRFLWSERECVM